ncbi:hypothetical protein [Caproiciproducens sp. CPB-2]|uniref:hypothetical protein n=1 Tax=Caproiciproducens sp. CPB-2 TaxID=3030017 RepID=UPI002E2FCBCC|nr:hypothetical protein [Caproiciproducens sp. CPB-2]
MGRGQAFLKKVKKTSEKGLTYGDVFGIIVKRLTKDAKRESKAEAAETQSGSGVFDQDLEN